MSEMLMQPFPTSVLIAVSSRQASFNEETSTITIVRHSKAAKIIDGQHRIAGLRGYRGPQFDVNVSVFIDMDLQDQAMVFATNQSNSNQGQQVFGI